MIHIIGGAKTGVNLFLFLKTVNVPVELYFFQGEYAEKKRLGKRFLDTWPGRGKINVGDKTIVSSESGFARLPEEEKDVFRIHYYLRDKQNLVEIAQRIGALHIQEYHVAEIVYPVALKPKESAAGKVPFKFKKVNNKEELSRINTILEHCLIQPYLSDNFYNQVAIAGYFDGNEASLVAVQQKNHYPKGISAYVIDQTSIFQPAIAKIASFLNEIGYRGFIEFEFKQSISTLELFIMDINPRPWGWFYYYLDGTKNFNDVIQKGCPLEVDLKPAWVNPLRLLAANIKGNRAAPSIRDFYQGNICYEPLF